MPRPPRLHVPGGVYHVMLRGNHREALFATHRDRRVLNQIVADVRDRLDLRIHAFCWMTNHLHLVVQIADRPLGEAVQRIAQRYARYRHKTLDTTGHLFERRYRCKLVDVDAYFMTLLRYIHLNPVKAELVRRPGDYPWSSHRAYLGMEAIEWLSCELGLSLFCGDPLRARLAYRHFISRTDDVDEPFEDVHHPEDSRVLGSDRFVANLPVAACQPKHDVTLEQLAEKICDGRGMGVDLLRSLSRARRLAPVRTEFARMAVKLRVATLAEVARFLNRDPSGLTQLLARHKSNN